MIGEYRNYLEMEKKSSSATLILKWINFRNFIAIIYCTLNKF